MCFPENSKERDFQVLVSICSSGWPLTHRESSASAFRVLGPKACATGPSITPMHFWEALLLGGSSGEHPTHSALGFLRTPLSFTDTCRPHETQLKRRLLDSLTFSFLPEKTGKKMGWAELQKYWLPFRKRWWTECYSCSNSSHPLPSAREEKGKRHTEKLSRRNWPHKQRWFPIGNAQWQALDIAFWPLLCGFQRCW